MAVKVAINGLGRIGRATFKVVLDTPGLELAAVNDLVSTDNLAYLLKYDTVYGRYEKIVDHTGNGLVVGGREYRVYNEKDPATLPWGDLGVDVVFECTGCSPTARGWKSIYRPGQGTPSCRPRTRERNWTRWFTG